MNQKRRSSPFFTHRGHQNRRQNTQRSQVTPRQIPAIHDLQDRRRRRTGCEIPAPRPCHSQPRPHPRPLRVCLPCGEWQTSLSRAQTDRQQRKPSHSCARSQSEPPSFELAGWSPDEKEAPHWSKLLPRAALSAVLCLCETEAEVGGRGSRMVMHHLSRGNWLPHRRITADRAKDRAVERRRARLRPAQLAVGCRLATRVSERGFSSKLGIGRPAYPEDENLAMPSTIARTQELTQAKNPLERRTRRPCFLSWAGTARRIERVVWREEPRRRCSQRSGVPMGKLRGSRVSRETSSGARWMDGLGS